MFEALLFRRLRNRMELLVRDGLRGNGQIAAEPCVQIGFADPAVTRNWFGGRGSSLQVRHAHLLATLQPLFRPIPAGESTHHWLYEKARIPTERPLKNS